MDHESSSDESYDFKNKAYAKKDNDDDDYVDNGNFKGKKVLSKKLRLDPPAKEETLHDLAEKYRSSVKNADSSVSVKDDKGWILWTKEEDEILLKAVNEGQHWTELSKVLPNKTARHCRKRYNVTLNDKLKRGNWSAEEDQQVVELVMKHGEKWAKIATEMPGRTADQIRGRYLVSLNPTNNTAPWTSEEYKILLTTHYKLGNQWVAIAKHLPGRQNKFISNHFKESVARKVEIFVSAKGKQNFGQLTEEEVDELIGYLHIKVAGAMKPLLKGGTSKKSLNNLEKTQMSGSKRRRSSAMLAASLTEGSNLGDANDIDLDEATNTKGTKKVFSSSIDDSSDEDSVDDILASLDDARGAVNNNRLDKPKYVKTTWTPTEDELLKEMFSKHRDKPLKWKVISAEFNKATTEGAVKDETQCERRWRSMPFTPADDEMIMSVADAVGPEGLTWKEVAKKILGHSGTQCQERWIKLTSSQHAAANNSSSSSSAVAAHSTESSYEPNSAIVHEAAIEIIPASDAVVSKFKKAKLTATKAAATLPEAELKDSDANKNKLKIKTSNSAIVEK